MAEPMLSHLARLQALRGAGSLDAAFQKRLVAVKDWQSRRLARTYADLAQMERYAPAVDFFLNDLYGPKDFSRRDAEMARIYPKMVKLLPASAVETVSLAMELDALSEELDQNLTRTLFAKSDTVTETSYLRAFRTCGPEEQRMRQVTLVGEVGQRLDAVVKRPFIYPTLKMLRQPARLAGLGDLQDFLEDGFAAFRHMKGADEFLAIVSGREAAIVSRIFSAHPAPFSQPDP